MVGRVEVPQEAFIAALSGDTEKKVAKKAAGLAVRAFRPCARARRPA
jgi:hypothetical protein